MPTHAANCPLVVNLDTAGFDVKISATDILLMSIKVFEYQNCDTCKKALKYLRANSLQFEKIPILEKPPSLSELKRMLIYLKEEGETFKKLFNISGVQYRELNLAEKLKQGLTENEALSLLATNGKLIKRPFLLTPTGGAVGFKQDQWARVLNLDKQY